MPLSIVLLAGLICLRPDTLNVFKTEGFGSKNQNNQDRSSKVLRGRFLCLLSWDLVLRTDTYMIDPHVHMFNLF